MDQNKRISEMFKKLILQFLALFTKDKKQKNDKKQPKTKKKNKHQLQASISLKIIKLSKRLRLMNHKGICLANIYLPNYFQAHK